ncbi:MAG: hypothetical protein P2A85_15750 [Microcoleus anatoxicus]|uniref:hypothetical protein n=1 Tax=Microcoleus anatoxicus TaxID=2705319 RepID=UPI003672EAE7
MVLRQYPLALFTTTLFITLTTQPGVAFTIKSLNPPDYYVPYTLGDAEGAAWIIPPTTIKAVGTLFALAVLPVIKRFKNRKNQE